MKLKQWQICHTYSTYFNQSLITLDKIAQILVENHIAECCIHKNGLFYYHDDGLQLGTSSATLHSNNQNANIVIEPKILNCFIVDSIMLASYFRVSEQNIFSKDFELLPNYIKAYIGECQLVSSERTVYIYPVLTIFDSGVILLEMRTLHPDIPIKVDDFIQNYVNLFVTNFDELLAPPDLVNSAIEDYSRNHTFEGKPTILNRYKIIHHKKMINRAVLNKTISRTSEDFNFKLSTLYNKDKEDKLFYSNSFLTFKSLSHVIISTVNFVINKTNNNLKYILSGDKKISELGNYWASKPHIHILDHTNQQNNSIKNEKKNGIFFGQIISRVKSNDKKAGLKFLPKSSRPFDDYSAYISSHATLWVWSTEGRKRTTNTDIFTTDKLIFQNQFLAELLDYGFILHKKYLELVKEMKNYRQVIALRKHILDLEIKMNESSRYGEIKDLLEDGWEKLHINKYKQLIKRTLNIHEDKFKIIEIRRFNKLNILLTIAFGLFAIPELSNHIIEPIWNLLKFPILKNSDGMKLTYIGISTVLITAIILLLKKIWIKNDFPK